MYEMLYGDRDRYRSRIGRHLHLSIFLQLLQAGQELLNLSKSVLVFVENVVFIYERLQAKFHEFFKNIRS